MPNVRTPDGLLDPTVELTFSQIREMIGVARTTLQRRLDGGLFPNARRRPGDSNRKWVVPIADLITAGLVDATEVADPDEMAHRADVEDQRAEIARLRAEVDGLKATLQAREDELEARRQEVDFLHDFFGRGRAA